MPQCIRIFVIGVITSFLLVGCSKSQPEANVLEARIIHTNGQPTSLKGDNLASIQELHGLDVLDIQTSQPGLLDSFWNCRVQDITDPKAQSPVYISQTQAPLNKKISLFSLMPEELVLAHEFDDEIYCNIHLKAQQQTTTNSINLKNVVIRRAISSGVQLQSVDDSQEVSVQMEKFEIKSKPRFTRQYGNSIKVYSSKPAPSQMVCQSVRSKNRLAYVGNKGRYLKDFFSGIEMSQLVNPIQQCRIVAYNNNKMIEAFSIPFEAYFEKMNIDFEWVEELPNTYRKWPQTAAQNTRQNATQHTSQALNTAVLATATKPQVSWSCFNWAKEAEAGGEDKTYAPTKIVEANKLWADTQKQVVLTNRHPFSVTYRIASNWLDIMTPPNGKKFDADVLACTKAYQKQFRAVERKADGTDELVSTITLAPNESRHIVFITPVWHPCAASSRASHTYKYWKRNAILADGSRIDHYEKQTNAEAGHTGACMFRRDDKQNIAEAFDLGIFIEPIDSKGRTLQYRQSLVEPSVLTLKSTYGERDTESEREYFKVDVLKRTPLPYAKK